MEGWIKLHRRLTDHWLYKTNKPKTRREAWEDMLLLVNFECKKVLIRGQLYECGRGQSLFSLDNWAKQFNWSIQQVRTFFSLLENDQMITIEGLQYTTRLTICNYELYQGSSTDEQQTKQHTNNTPITDQQHAANMPLTTTKESKELKNEKNIDIKLYNEFDIFRKNYPGTKRGCKTELDNFKKKHADWKEVIPKLNDILINQNTNRDILESQNKFVPEWKNLQTWINQRCWEEEFTIIEHNHKSLPKEIIPPSHKLL